MTASGTGAGEQEPAWGDSSPVIVYLSCGHRIEPYHEPIPVIGASAWCTVDTHVTVISREAWDALPELMKFSTSRSEQERRWRWLVQHAQPEGPLPDEAGQPEETQMREVREPTRGSGAVDCCGGHRERCLFGHQHTWSRPWFENGRVQRLATTYHCHVCGGVCTAEEGDCDRCGATAGGAPVTQPGDRLRRHWCGSQCRDAALAEESQPAETRALSEGSGPTGQVPAGWQDTPEVRDALGRAAEILAILALPDEEAARARLAARGLYPVAVVHGEPDSDVAVELICGRMSRAAERLGCRHKSGGNDATTYLFPARDAAVDFLAEVSGFAESWWTLTATARPVYNRGGSW